MKSLKYHLRQIKKLPTWIYFFPASLLRLYRLTLHIKITDPHETIDENKFPFVSVFWHNRLLLFPLLFRRKIREQSYAVISASRDGQYLADLISYFGVKSIRGSSSRKGVKVIIDGLKVLTNEKKNICMTPDGPRGPKYKMSKGAIQLASSVGCPVLPIAINASNYWQLNSWDNFQIPKPFSKVELVMGKPINIPKDLTPEKTKEYQDLIEKKLLEMNID